MNKEKIKIVFIGGLPSGKVVFDYLLNNRFVNLVLTITYPDNTEKPRFIKNINTNNLVKDNSANKYLSEIKKVNPDFIFVAGWSEFLKDELISIPKFGTIGFHPSKLPDDRGRSVLAWQIEEGYTETALTMFYYNDFPDGGDIIAQEKIVINFNDYINDILDKVDEAIFNLMKAYFPLIRKGKAPRKKQDLNKGSVRRLRTNRDSIVDWNRNSVEIYNKIRAISQPYPGATAIIEGKNFIIWKAEVCLNFISILPTKPGTKIATLFDKSIIIKTKDNFLRILEYKIID